MAKVIVRDLADFRYTTIKAIADEVAEDYPALEVSSGASDTDYHTLILTIDTDLVASISLPITSTYFGARSVTFNGNSLVSSNSGSSTNGAKLIIAYTDDFFLFWLKYAGTAYNTILFALYEKIEGERLATGYAGSSLPELTPLYDMNKVQVLRQAFSGSGYISPAGYIDYMDKTSLYRNGSYNRVGLDDNFLYVLSNISLIFNIITIDNKDYYALTNRFLIPIDSE